MRTMTGGGYTGTSHPEEDAFMIPGYGAQPVPPEKYVAANDNVPGYVNGDVGGPLPADRGIYIGLTRREVSEQPAANDTEREASELTEEDWRRHAAETSFAFQQIDDDLITTTFAPLEDIAETKASDPKPTGFYAGLTQEQKDVIKAGRGEPEGGVAFGDPAFSLRAGSFMQTYSGRKFWPLDPRPEDVHIEDIAHSLSLQCRYAGHCISFYSVAEHSVHVARWLLKKYGPLMALHGLLHDAPEAYVVDVPRPLKRHLDHYRAVEERVYRQAIAPRFGLAAIIPAAVHEADNRIIADELKLLRPMEWHARHNDPLGVPVAGWHPDAAEDEFLACYVMLERKLKEEGRR